MTSGGRDWPSMSAVGSALVIGSFVVGLLLTLALAEPQGVILLIAYAGIGAFLAIRRPANSIGWLLMLIGSGLALGSMRVEAPIGALHAGLLDPQQAFATWANGCGWTIAFIGYFGISITFPNGRLPAGRAGRPARIGLGLIVTLALLLAFGPTAEVIMADTGASVSVPNPYAVVPDAPFWPVVPGPTELTTTTFAIVVVGFLGLFRRYRRSVGAERLQYRWLVAAVALVAVATVAWAIAVLFLDLPQGGFASIVSIVAYLAVPIAIAVAVLRYRLYDLDRLISRTIAYASVSAILLAVFGTGIVVLSTALSSVAEGQTLAIAGSTLIAYAAVQPVLRRVRRAVDRRFDRARYDHERTVTDFSARLRDEINVDALTADLTTTTRAAVVPSSVTLWLRSGPTAR